MKSYNHLWEMFISDNNIRLAIINATQAKGKTRNRRKRDLYKYYHQNPDPLIPRVREYAENFYNDNHESKQIFDGISRKQRNIVVPTLKEHIVHHMIINVLESIFMRGFYEHSYGSIPGRGSLKGRRYRLKRKANG